MEKLKLQIKHEDKIVSTEIPNPTDEMKYHVLDSLLSMVNPQMSVCESADSKQFAQSLAASIRGLDRKLDEVPVAAAVAEPIISASSSSLQKLQAHFNGIPDDKQEEILPEGMKRNKLDEVVYKCRYKCTSNICNTESNHYVRPGTKTVTCHNCDTEMQVKKATQDDEITPDPYNNYYVAGNRKPYYEFNGM